MPDDDGCGWWEAGDYCGWPQTRMYMVGRRCPAHTPARLAGKVEPDVMAAVRLCTACGWWPGRHRSGCNLGPRAWVTVDAYGRARHNPSPAS